MHNLFVFLILGCLFLILEAVKSNPKTADATERDIEQATARYFKGAPDKQGEREQRRLKARRSQNVSNLEENDSAA